MPRSNFFQLDSNLGRLRRIAGGKGSDSVAVAEVFSNMTRLRSVLEEERARFQGAVVQMRQKHTIAVQQGMRLSQAVIEVGSPREITQICVIFSLGKSRP